MHEALKNYFHPQQTLPKTVALHWHPWFQFPNALSLVFLPIKITLKQFIERFLVRQTKSLTKNPSRNRFNVFLMTKKTRL